MADIEVGSVWVRKSDGQKTTVLSTQPATMFNGWVTHRAKRLTHTERQAFLRKYEPAVTEQGENREEQDRG